MMQLGFHSAILPDLSLDAIMKIAAEIGYSCVEVMCWPPSKAERRYAGVTHIDLTEFSDKSIATILQTVQSSGVAISALGYYPNCLAADEAESKLAIEHLCRVIEAAPKLGLTTVNTFIGRNPKQSIEENWPRMLKVWKPILDLAESKSVRIGIENCPMFFSKDEWPGGKNIATSPAIWRRLFYDLSSPNLGLNYDPSHMIWQFMDYLAPMREFSSRLFHIHAKDARIDRQRLNDVGVLAHPNEFHTPKLPGLGEVDWGAFFSTLGDVEYDGCVCVEVEDRSYEGSLELRIESLRQSYRYLRQFMPAKI